MGEEKIKRERAEKVFGAKIAIIVAVISAVVGIAGSVGGSFWIQNSKNARRCAELETEVKHKDELLQEKRDRIHEQRLEIVELKQAIQAKDNLLASKETDIHFLQMKVYEKDGRFVTRNDEELLKMVGGAVRDRLGVDDSLPIFDKIRAGWKKPLAMGLLPGVFIPAPDGLVDAYEKMLTFYEKGDYTNAVRIAMREYQRLAPMIEPFSSKGIQIDGRFAAVAGEIYRVVAEDAFYHRQYQLAVHLMGQCAGLYGKIPPPCYLALESAMLYKAGYSHGFYTQHMHDAIEAKNDENYRYEIFNELAKIGYLQRYMPNADCTDIGELIDWDKDFKKKLELRKMETRGKDVWSVRWIGYGLSEWYNLSEEYRRHFREMESEKKNK